MGSKRMHANSTCVGYKAYAFFLDVRGRTALFLLERAQESASLSLATVAGAVLDRLAPVRKKY